MSAAGAGAGGGDTGAVITGVGMVTSIGYRAWPAAAAMVARAKRFFEMDEVLDREGEPVVAAPVKLFADSSQPSLELALAAAGEAIAQAFGGADDRLESLRVWVSMSSGPSGAAKGPSALGVRPRPAGAGHPGAAPRARQRAAHGPHAAGLLAARDAVDRLRDRRSTSAWSAASTRCCRCWPRWTRRIG